MLRTSLLTCAFLAVAVPAYADSQALKPVCGLTVAAPKLVRQGETIPSNTPALAFAFDPRGGTIDGISLTMAGGTAPATTREDESSEIVVRMSAPLQAGGTYTLATSSTCVPGLASAPASVITFDAGPASPLPTTMGTLAQTNDGEQASAGAAGSRLVLSPSADARAFLAVTRFRVSAVGSSDPGITTAYGGEGSDIYGTGVIVTSAAEAFCPTSGAPPSELVVRAYLAGASEPYETQKAPIDIRALCTKPSAPSSGANGGGGGCSVAHPASPGAGVLAALSALVFALRRRRST